MDLPVVQVLWRVETGGLLGLAGCQTSSRFSKRPCLKRIRWRMLEHLEPFSVLYVYIQMYIYHTDRHTHMYTHRHKYTYRYTQTHGYTHIHTSDFCLPLQHHLAFDSEKLPGFVPG